MDGFRVTFQLSGYGPRGIGSKVKGIFFAASLVDFFGHDVVVVPSSWVSGGYTDFWV